MRVRFNLQVSVQRLRFVPSWLTSRHRQTAFWPAYTNSLTTWANKFAKSNLGRGPRRGTVAHVRRKVPIGYNGAPQIRAQKYPLPWTDPRTPLSASSLDPSDLSRQTASGSDPPFFPPCTGQTDALTDRSSTGKFDHYRPLRYDSDAA